MVLADDWSGLIYLTLRRERLSKRNIDDPGCGVLRPSISYSLCFIAMSYYLASHQSNCDETLMLKEDEEINYIKNTEKKIANSIDPINITNTITKTLWMDPMCGAGTIPIEGAKNWPNTQWLCGDISNNTIKRCQHNVEEAKLQSSISVNRWDATSLPIPNTYVDVITTDLPFGKRHGNHQLNHKIYPEFLKECVRVLKVGGILLLLTTEKKLMNRLLQQQKHNLVTMRQFSINNGGLSPSVFLLRRRNTPVKDNTKRTLTRNDEEEPPKKITKLNSHDNLE